MSARGVARTLAACDGSEVRRASRRCSRCRCCCSSGSRGPRRPTWAASSVLAGSAAGAGARALARGDPVDAAVRGELPAPVPPARARHGRGRRRARGAAGADARAGSARRSTPPRRRGREAAASAARARARAGARRARRVPAGDRPRACSPSRRACSPSLPSGSAERALERGRVAAALGLDPVAAARRGLAANARVQLEGRTLRVSVPVPRIVAGIPLPTARASALLVG